ncbi:MAG: metal-dependent transcriptional regulator [Candidatus Schekmanbacteria bacterium]|nr:metal-dependent transcriptional regulator [Candidatus Schekmanbacteria bacterium]
MEKTVEIGITSQGEEYLEAVCRIRERGIQVTATELAQSLNLAPPSVLGMLKRLEEQGMLSYSRQKGVLLTEKGELHAHNLRRRHRLAERLLTDLLGMPWERAHEVACRFEHIIDDEVEKYLLEALHYPHTCPHGNPIDTQDQEIYQPLTTLSVGQTGYLRRILDESSETLNYLHGMSLIPGAEVTVYAVAPSDGPLTVDVAGNRFAISRVMAGQLLVERK